MNKLSSLTHFILQSVMALLIVGGVLTSMGIVDFGLKDLWVAKEQATKKDKVTDNQKSTPKKAHDLNIKSDTVAPTKGDLNKKATQVKVDITNKLNSVKKSVVQTKSEN